MSFEDTATGFITKSQGLWQSLVSVVDTRKALGKGRASVQDESLTVDPVPVNV